MQPRTVADSHSVLVQWMGPSDANAVGYVHGGTVMKLCDEAAAAAAIRHCRLRVVTAAVDCTSGGAGAGCPSSSSATIVM